MFDLVERTELLIEESLLYASIMAAKGDERSPIAIAFPMIHNKAMITREMLQFYYRLWTGGRKLDVDEDELGAEMAERAVYISKMLFIEVLSAIEHSAKKVCRRRGKDLPYLRSIMDASFADGSMTADRNREWNDIITLRNLAVHDNSISDRSKRCTVGHLTISMRPNRMMRGPVHTFIELSRLANQYYYEWLCSLLAAEGQAADALAVEGNV